MISISINSNKKESKQVKYNQLFNLYYSPLVGFAYSYLKNREEAEDKVQDVFCNLWNRIDEIDYQANVKSFLFTSTKNLCISTLRHRICGEKFRINQIDTQLGCLALEYSTIKQVELNELKEQIDNILKSMSPDVREIFVKNRDGGKSYVEIAQELDISVKTVEKKMSKAIKIFRKNLSEYDFLLFLILLPKI